MNNSICIFLLVPKLYLGMGLCVPNRCLSTNHSEWLYFSFKGTIKLHTLLVYDGHLPSFINITNSKTADNKGAENIPIPENSIIVADRFYQDFSLLNKWDSKHYQRTLQG